LIHPLNEYTFPSDVLCGAAVILVHQIFNDWFVIDIVALYPSVTDVGLTVPYHVGVATIVTVCVVVVSIVYVTVPVTSFSSSSLNVTVHTTCHCD
jgi:hypothetical protein